MSSEIEEELVALRDVVSANLSSLASGELSNDERLKLSEKTRELLSLCWTNIVRLKVQMKSFLSTEDSPVWKKKLAVYSRSLEELADLLAHHDSNATPRSEMEHESYEGDEECRDSSVSSELESRKIENSADFTIESSVSGSLSFVKNWDELEKGQTSRDCVKHTPEACVLVEDHRLEQIPQLILIAQEEIRSDDNRSIYSSLLHPDIMHPDLRIEDAAWARAGEERAIPLRTRSSSLMEKQLDLLDHPNHHDREIEELRAQLSVLQSERQAAAKASAHRFVPGRTVAPIVWTARGKAPSAAAPTPAEPPFAPAPQAGSLSPPTPASRHGPAVPVFPAFQTEPDPAPRLAAAPTSHRRPLPSESAVGLATSFGPRAAGGTPAVQGAGDADADSGTLRPAGAPDTFTAAKAASGPGASSAAATAAVAKTPPKTGASVSAVPAEGRRPTEPGAPAAHKSSPKANTAQPSPPPASPSSSRSRQLLRFQLSIK